MALYDRLAAGLGPGEVARQASRRNGSAPIEIGGVPDRLRMSLAMGDPRSSPRRKPIDILTPPPIEHRTGGSPFIQLPGMPLDDRFTPKRRTTGYIGGMQIGRNIFGDVEEFVTGLSTLGALAVNRVVTSVVHPSTIPELPGRLAEFGKLAFTAFVDDIKEYRDDFWGKVQRDPLFTMLDLGGITSFGTSKGASIAARMGAKTLEKTLLQADEFATVGKVMRQGVKHGQKRLTKSAKAAKERARVRGVDNPTIRSADGELDPTKFEQVIMNFDTLVGTEGIARVFTNMIVDPGRSYRRKLVLGSYRDAYKAVGKLDLKERGQFVDFIEGTFLFDDKARAEILGGVSEEFVEAVRVWKDEIQAPWEDLLARHMHIMTKAQQSRTRWLPMMVKEVEDLTNADANAREFGRLSATEVRELQKGKNKRFEVIEGKKVLRDNITGKRYIFADESRYKDTKIKAPGPDDVMIPAESGTLHNVTLPIDQVLEFHARVQRNMLEDGHFIFDNAFEGKVREVAGHVGTAEDGSKIVRRLVPHDLARQDRITEFQRVAFMKRLGLTDVDISDPVAYLNAVNRRAKFVQDVEVHRAAMASAYERYDRAASDYFDELDHGVDEGRWQATADAYVAARDDPLLNMDAATSHRIDRARRLGATPEELASRPASRAGALQDAAVQADALDYERSLRREEAATRLAEHTQSAEGFRGSFRPEAPTSTRELEQLRQAVRDVDEAPSGIELVAPAPKFIDPLHFSVVMQQELQQRRIFSNLRRLITKKDVKENLVMERPEIRSGDVSPGGSVRNTHLLDERTGRGIFKENREGRTLITDPDTKEIRHVDIETEPELAAKVLDLEGTVSWILRERASFVRSVDMARAITDEFAFEIIPARVRKGEQATPARLVQTDPTGKLKANQRDIVAQFDTTAELLDSLLKDGIEYNGRIFEARLWMPEHYEAVKGSEHAISELFAAKINQGRTTSEAMLEAISEVVRDEPTVRAIEASTKRGSKIYVIPDKVAKQIRDLSDELPETGDSFKGLLKAGFDDVADGYRTMWLHTPRFVFNTLATNTAMAALAGIGVRDVIDAVKQKNKVILEPIVELQANQRAVEAGASSLNLRSSKNFAADAVDEVKRVWAQEGLLAVTVHLATAQPIAPIVESIDNLFRRAAFIKQARTKGTATTLKNNPDAFKSMLANMDDEQLAATFSTLEHPEMLRSWADARQMLIDGELMNDMTQRLHMVVGEPQAFMDGVKFTNDWFFNYFSLSKFERTYVRRVLPFWNWMKNMHKLAGKLPTDHPGRSMIVAHMGAVAGDLTDQEDLPNFLKGTVEADFANLQRLRGGGMNPFETVIFREPSAGGMAARAVQSANPLIQFFMMAGTASKVFPVGREFSDENIVRTYNRHMRINPVTHEVVGEEDAVFPAVPQYFLGLLPQLKAIESGARAMVSGAGALFPDRESFQRSVNAIVGDPPMTRRSRDGTMIYPQSDYKSLLQYFGLSLTPMQSPDQERLNQMVKRSALLVYDRVMMRENVRKEGLGHIRQAREVLTGQR